MERYREIVAKLCKEPDSPIVVGSFLDLEEGSIQSVARKEKISKTKAVKKGSDAHDIRMFLLPAAAGCRKWTK